jgi:ABC-2 type transport system permease protein
VGEVAAVLRTYRYLVGARIRSDWQYRVSFALFMLSQTVIAGLDLAVIVVLFDVVDALGGWTVDQVAVLYGFTMLSFGLGDLFVSQVEAASRHIREGTFDRFLLRPLPSILQLSAMEFALRRVGRSVPGLVVLALALTRADIDWTVDRVLLVPVTIVSGLAIFGSVWVVTSSISFWAVGAQEVANTFTYGGSFAHQYPLHVYARWLRTALGWVVPMAFVAYVPALHLLDAPNPLDLPPWLSAAPPVVAFGCVLVARWVWGLAIRHHQSTGS